MLSFEPTKAIEAFTSKTHHSADDDSNLAGLMLDEPLNVCIIGASRGIGAAVAERFAVAGAGTIIIAARSSLGLAQTAARIEQLTTETETTLPKNSTVISAICDVGDEASIRALAETVRNSVSKLHVLIYCSGFAGALSPNVTDGDTADFTCCFDTNVRGTYLVARYLLPQMTAWPDNNTAAATMGGQEDLPPPGPPVFLAVSATAAWIVDGPIANPGYCISKLAQARLIESLANQYRRQHLFTLAVHPGAVETEMAKTAPPQFIPYLVDSPNLCGAFCVWLVKTRLSNSWLTGRFVSANWNVGELATMKERIIKDDLLKIRLHMPN